MSTDFDTSIAGVNTVVLASLEPVTSVVAGSPSSPVTDTVFTYGLGSAATRVWVHVKVAVVSTAKSTGVGDTAPHCASVITGVYGTSPVFTTVIVYVNVSPTCADNLSTDFDTVMAGARIAVDAASFADGSVVAGFPSFPVTYTVFTYGSGSVATRTCVHVKVADPPGDRRLGAGERPTHSVSVSTGVYATAPLFVTVIV